MNAGKMKGPCAFDKLFARNVPHILEMIFFSLDYESFKKCVEVNRAWKEQITSMSFQVKAKSMFAKEIQKDQEKLLAVSREGNVAEARQLLSSGLLNVNYLFGSLCSTPLMKAASNGSLKLVQFLLNEGAEVNKANNFEDTPLHFAACKGHKDAVKVLLERGAQPDWENRMHVTPLYLASLKCHKDVVNFLLERGADPNKATKEGYTPLHAASSRRHKDVVKLLLEKGADPNKANKGGNTPLHLASQIAHKDGIKLLLDAGADPNKANEDGKTPLDYK